jgi:very-short-patch-repair endonuclease
MIRSSDEAFARAFSSRPARGPGPSGGARPAPEAPGRAQLRGPRLWHGACAKDGRAWPSCRAERLSLPRSCSLASLSPAARRAAESYRARLELFAARMRFVPSPLEAKLWSALKGSQLGVGFRRQVILGDAAKKLYIVDFCAPKLKLVVELDDASHVGRERQDARRDATLGRLGYRVVRIPASLVERNVEEAVARVREALR